MFDTMKTKIVFFLIVLGFLQLKASNEASDNFIKALKAFEKYSDTQWTDYKEIPNTGYWGSGLSGEKKGTGNDAIRSMNGVALAHAVLIMAEPENKTQNAKRLEKIEKVLRYSSLTHKQAGMDYTCRDGLKWGLGWQTNMWAGSMGLACALMEDRLPEDLVKQCKKVVAAEADFRAGIAPASEYVFNTAAEENAWNSNILSLAAAWMSDYDNAKKWLKAAKIYLSNTYSVAADKNGDMSEWVTTINLYPSFMLENHGFYHPGYQNVSGASLGDSFLMAYLTNKKVAEELTPFAEHNVMNVWNKIYNILKTNSEMIYPCGEDWSLHNYGQVSYYAYIATHFKEPVAVKMQNEVIKRLLERQALFGTGEFIGKSNENTFYVEAVTARRTALAWLHNYVNDFKLVEPADMKDINSIQDDVKIFTSRSKYGNVTLSYGLRILLAAESAPGNTPQTQYISCTDRYNVIGKTPYGIAKKAKLLNHEMTKNGFKATLEVEAQYGKLQYSIYTDNGIVAIIQKPLGGEKNSDTAVSFPLGIENYVMNGGKRDFYSQEGHIVINETSGLEKDFSNAVNISDNYGVIYGPDAKCTYKAPKAYNRRGASVDMISANLKDQFAPSYMIILCNRDWKQTQKIAETVMFINDDNTLKLMFSNESGNQIYLSL